MSSLRDRGAALAARASPALDAEEQRAGAVTIDEFALQTLEAADLRDGVDGVDGVDGDGRQRDS
jgi:hypothetical protein